MLRLILIFVFILAAFFFSRANQREYNQHRKHFIIFVVMLLILQSGLRNVAVGSDTYQYFINFEIVRLTSWSDIINSFLNNDGNKDPFYDVFQKSFQFFTDDYQLYLFFVAIIFMPALGHFIYKNTTKINHALIAFIIYLGNFYGFFSITGIRQTIATAILLYSYEAVKRRKLIIFSSLVLLASFFHVSALIFSPFYFVAEIRKPKLLFRLAILGFPICLYFKNSIAIFLVNFVNAGDRFGNYTEQFEIGGSLVLTALHVLLAIVGLKYYNKTISIAPETYRMFSMFALALFLFPLQWVNPSAGRIAQYFTIVIMVWIPFLLDASSINKPKFREFIYIGTVILLVFFTFFAITDGEYKFFWENMKLDFGY